MLFERFPKIGAACQQAKRRRDFAGALLEYGYDDLAPGGNASGRFLDRRKKSLLSKIE